MPRWLRLILGVCLLLLGIAGVVLPILQGVVFLLMAGILLAPDFPPARRAVVKSFRRWPKVRRKVPRKFRDLARRDPSFDG
jgi:uncharacterized membrane protein YbaN (DUF454 family)